MKVTIGELKQRGIVRNDPSIISGEATPMNATRFIYGCCLLQRLRETINALPTSVATTMWILEMIMIMHHVFSYLPTEGGIINRQMSLDNRIKLFEFRLRVNL